MKLKDFAKQGSMSNCLWKFYRKVYNQLYFEMDENLDE